MLNFAQDLLLKIQKAFGVRDETQTHAVHQEEGCEQPLNFQAISSSQFADHMGQSREEIRRLIAEQCDVPQADPIDVKTSPQDQQAVLKCQCPSCLVPLSVHIQEAFYDV